MIRQSALTLEKDDKSKEETKNDIKREKNSIIESFHCQRLLYCRILLQQKKFQTLSFFSSILTCVFML